MSIASYPRVALSLGGRGFEAKKMAEFCTSVSAKYSLKD